MNLPNLTAILEDALPIIIGGSVAAVLMNLIFYRSPDADQIRKQLGGKLDAYSSVPKPEMDEALVLSAKEARTGLRVLRPSLSVTLLLVLAWMSAEIFRECFPHNPSWHGHGIAGLVAGLLTWPTLWLERRAIVSRLRQRVPVMR